MGGNERREKNGGGKGEERNEKAEGERSQILNSENTPPI